MTHLRLVFSTFLWLIWRDIRVISKDLINNLIDVSLLPTGWLFMSGYIMPYLGLPADYGTFMMAGTISGMCYGSTGSDAGNLVNDLEGPKSISYELSLPITSWLVCGKYAVVYALKCTLLNTFFLPIGILLLGKKIALSQISWGKFLLIYGVMNLLYGFLALVIALWAKDAADYGRFWVRWGWLVFTLSCCQFSWFVAQQAVPMFAYLSLLNPLVYPHEGMRAALLGQEGYINYWLCLLATLVFTMIFAVAALKLFKRRLDCV